MSDQNRVQLSDQEKIDRAAFHEEVRFYKKQQWAVATAGVVLLGAFLATVNDVHMTALDKFLAVVLIALGVCAGGYFLDSLQTGLADVRRRLDPSDLPLNFHPAAIRASANVTPFGAVSVPA
jgi:uncharacterized membrane protein